MTPINATLVIRASADSVWASITHFAKYAEWNRLTPTIDGAAQLNARLGVTLAPTGHRPIALKARVLVAARNRELRWCGTGWMPRSLKVEHGFRIEQRADGCRVYHSLSCTGWRAKERLIEALRQAFEATNMALVARIGAAPEPSPSVPIVLAADAAASLVMTSG